MNLSNIIHKYRNKQLLEDVYFDSLSEVNDDEQLEDNSQQPQQNAAPAQQQQPQDFQQMDPNLYQQQQEPAQLPPAPQPQADPNAQPDMSQQPQQLPPPPGGAQPQADPNAMAGVDPNAAQPGMDPNVMAAGGDPNAMAAGQPGANMGADQELPRTSQQVGRLYEMKKINMRLYVLSKMLNQVSNKGLQETKKLVDEAFDIYRIILNNYSKYRDQMDEIILRYYDFIGNVTKEMKEYFEKKETKQNEEIAIKNIQMLRRESVDPIKKKLNIQKSIANLEAEKARISKIGEDTHLIDSRIDTYRKKVDDLNHTDIAADKFFRNKE